MNTIDFRTLSQNVPTICIPRVFPNINESRIRKVFDDLKMGQIERVDIVSKTTEKGEKFNRVFVHFKKWNSEGNAQVARERLLNGKDIKIVYDDPWFWKVSAYRQPEKEHQQKPAYKKPAYKKPTIVFDDSDEERKPRSSRPANMKFRKADMDTKKQKQEVQYPRRNSSPSSPTRINVSPRNNSTPSSPSPRSPSSSPPRRPEIQEEDDIQPPIPKVDYGKKITIPKKRNVVKKTVAPKPEIKIEKMEAGEV